MDRSEKRICGCVRGEISIENRRKEGCSDTTEERDEMFRNIRGLKEG
jgi:hypothetical protein